MAVEKGPWWQISSTPRHCLVLGCLHLSLALVAWSRVVLTEGGNLSLAMASGWSLRAGLYYLVSALALRRR